MASAPQDSTLDRDSAVGCDAAVLAEDLDLLHINRSRVLAQRPALIIPGNGAPFVPTFG